MIGKLKKDSAAYTHQCSGEGREKREGKSLCGGNHITSLLYLREERKKVLTHSCKGILHPHRYALSSIKVIPGASVNKPGTGQPPILVTAGGASTWMGVFIHYQVPLAGLGCA